jgi:hypothetical protein
MLFTSSRNAFTRCLFPADAHCFSSEIAVFHVIYIVLLMYTPYNELYQLYSLKNLRLSLRFVTSDTCAVLQTDILTYL